MPENSLVRNIWIPGRKSAAAHRRETEKTDIRNIRKNYKLSVECHVSLLPHKVLLTKHGYRRYFSVWMLAREDFCKHENPRSEL